MRFTHGILPALLVFTACAHAADTPTSQISTVGDLASLLEGEFTTATAPVDGPSTPQAKPLSILAKRVQVPALGRDVVYAELREDGPNGQVVRRRLYSLKLDDQENHVTMTAFSAGNSAELAGAYADSAPLAKLNVSDLKPEPGSCAIAWHKTEGGFDGDIDPATCKNTPTGGGKTVISVSKTGMTELLQQSPVPIAFRRLR